MKNKTNTAILLAAALYAVSTPVSKMLLSAVQPTMVAAFLYLGAGIGMDAMMLGRRISHRQQTEQRLGRRDAPFAAAMVVLDIATPILMM